MKKVAKKLDEIFLSRGSHSSIAEGMCVMEAAAWVAGEPHSDHPRCVSHVIAAFLRSWNDGLPDDERQMLKPYVVRVVDTAAGSKAEAERIWLIRDWIIRGHTPAWLDLALLHDEATALRAWPEIKTVAGLKRVKPLLDEARKKGAAAKDAALDAARDAAWAAARDAAWDAAWAAARDTAWDAVGAAAWDAVGAAAWDAVGAAVGAAAVALEPTKKRLQASALKLLDRLIEVSSRRA